jgi:hypothetical protein
MRRSVQSSNVAHQQGTGELAIVNQGAAAGVMKMALEELRALMRGIGTFDGERLDSGKACE